MEKEAAIVISKTTIKKAGAILGIGGFIVLATMGLHLRAASGDVPPMRLVPVAVETVARQESYQVNEFYAGRVEAKQTVNLSFEHPGKIEEILVEEGDFVKEGDVVAKLDTALLIASRNQTRGTVSRIAAQLELAKLTEARQKELFEQGHSSEQQYDEARLNRQALDAQLAETRAALQSIKINIEKSSLLAPFDGQIGARSVDTGGVLNAGMTVVTLLESGDQQARISIPSDRIAAVRAGELQVSYRGNSIAAEVAAIRADVNPATRTQDVLLTIKSATPIAFGDLVELALPETRVQQGYWMPVEALVEGKKGLWNIFAVETDEEGDRVARRAIEVAYAETGRVFVTANMGDEARFVANGTHRVVPGQYIDPIDAEEQ